MSGRRPLGEMLADRIAGPEPTSPTNPITWAAEVLGVQLWSAQRRIAEAVLAHPYVAVKSAHATGKSKLAAVLMAWWIAGAGRPLGDAFAISTAPTQTQLSAVVWRELGRAHRMGRLPGRITGGAVPAWSIDGEVVALGRKPADLLDVEAAASQFQGVHARYPLAVIDEAGGVGAWVFDAVDAVATSEGSRVLAIGNPTDPSSRFAEVCAPGSGWHVLTVPAESTPAFTGEQVPAELLELLVSPRWVQERRERWGEDSPLFRARVLAEFPTSSEDALVEPGWVEAAQRAESSGQGAPVFGVDVARSGSDETIVVENRGGRLRVRHRAQGADLMATTGTVARLLADAGEGAAAVVDVIGIGAGVFDRLREQGAAVLAFNSSERASDAARYRNRRAEGYWQLREALREERLDLDPADDELAAQLLALKWSVDSGGRIGIETKAELAKRGIASPDRADAAMMSLAGRPPGGGPAAFAIKPILPGPNHFETLAPGRIGEDVWRVSW